MGVKGGELHCGVSAEGVSSVRAMEQGVCLRHGAVCEVGVYMKQSTPPIVLFPCTTQCINSKGVGENVATRLRGDEDPAVILQMAWWEGHMVDGCVQISAEIKRVANSSFLCGGNLYLN